MYKFLVVFCGVLLWTQGKSQDTITVQTLTFEDITKRRGVFTFPEEGEYEKVLMYYTLKCDAKTTQDRYACGEWDYLTYTFLYDHDATFDSTYSTARNFRVNETNQDTFRFTSKPVEIVEGRYVKNTKVSNASNEKDFVVGNGTEEITTVLPISSFSGRTQILYSAEDLLKAGLTAGNIDGLAFDFVDDADRTHFKIKIASVGIDSLLEPMLDESQFTTVAEYQQSFDQGLQKIYFDQEYNWNGISDLLIDVSFQNRETGNNVSLNGHLTPEKTLANVEANLDYALDLGTWRDMVRLGKNDSINGNKSRTIEIWVKPRSFNNGGVFQAGITGSTDRDFSLRTTNTDNKWRIQLWGSDGDAIFTSKDEWHHLALSYDGKEAKLFVDGKLFRKVTADLNTGDIEVLLGRWNNSFFNGMLDHVRVWNVALNAATIKEWMVKEVTSAHPKYAHLQAKYECDEGSGDVLINSKGKMKSGTMLGSSWWALKAPEDLRQGWSSSKARPNITFLTGDFTRGQDSIVLTSSRIKPPVTLYSYDNPSSNVIIDDDAENHPKLVTSVKRMWQAGIDVETYDEISGNLKTVKVPVELEMVRDDKTWYSPTVRYEIARYITPYGKGLSLGPKGFTWVFDVTDYAPLLKGEVDLSAGNQQELIDLQFKFVKGSAPRDVVKLKNIWPYGSRKYSALSDDSQLEPTTISLEDDAKTFKVKTRLTGHGHNSNNGEHPHCCEWKDNTHYLYVNKKKEAEWHIWREDCDRNPVYPQGGTWTGAREGWCPGDVVPDYEFEITSSVGGKSSVELDYRITKVPENNLGMGNGNYVQNMELVQYGAFKRKLDVEIYDVVRPNNWEYYSKINPSCESPIIEVRNSGSETLTSLSFKYWVEGNEAKTYDWTGSLKSMDKERIALPLDGSYFWVGSENTFHVEVSKPNGSTDEYTQNNSATKPFEVPEIYKGDVIVQLRTNNVPDANRYEVRDASGKVVYSQDNFEANTTYTDTMDLAKGCYTFHFYDEGYGLSYWAWPDQGNGYLRLRSAHTGKMLKDFNPDFGEEIQYGFAISSISTVEEKELANKVEVYPNPNAGRFSVELNQINSKVNIELVDMAGNLLEIRVQRVGEFAQVDFDIENVKSGVYFVRVTSDRNQVVKKVVVEQ